jgi:hypothetical protein
MGGTPAAPSNTQQQTTNVMDPKLYELLYGAKNSPGSILLGNASRNASMFDLAQQGDPAAMAKLYGTKDYKNLPVYNPSKMPFASSTPAQVAQAKQPAPSAAPTPDNSPFSKDVFAAANQAGQANQAQQAQGLYGGGEVQSFAVGQAVAAKPKAASVGKPRYSNADAVTNQFNQYYDPKTGLSTNPYFQKGVGVLESMKMPEQYGQAGDLALSAGEGLANMSNYAPGQIKPTEVQGATMQGPDAWNTQQAQNYMNPYINTALQSQNDLSNRQFNSTMQGLRSQQAGAGAFGGSRGAIQEQQAQQGQNLNLQNLNAQGLNQAYNTGMGAFQNQQGMQQNANQANAGWAQQANLANQQTDLTAQTQNQQAGLQANQQNQGALTASGGMGAGLVNAGQAQSAWGNQQANNWGTAATALQNVGKDYWGGQQQNAQNWMNATPNAAAPAAAMVAGQTWGGSNKTNQSGSPSTMAKGGFVKRKWSDK